MKSKFYIFSILIIFFFGCVDQIDIELEKGFILDGNYYNKQLEWSMPVSENLSIPNELEKEDHILTKISLVSDPDKVINLLKWNEGKLSNINITYDTNKYNDISSLNDYTKSWSELYPLLIKSIQNQISRTSNESPKIEITDLSEKIDRVIFKGQSINIKIDTMNLSFLLLAAKLKGGFLTIGLTSTNTSLKKDFLKALKASSFSITSFPEAPMTMSDSTLLDSLPFIFKSDAEMLFQSYLRRDYLKAASYIHPKVFMEIEKKSPGFNKERFLTMVFDEYSIKDSSDSNSQFHFLAEPPRKIESYQGFYFTIVNAKLSLYKEDKQNKKLPKMPISLIGIYSQKDNRSFFIDNSLFAFEIVAKDIPRHVLRKIVLEKDYLNSFNSMENEWYDIIKEY